MFLTKAGDIAVSIILVMTQPSEIIIEEDLRGLDRRKDINPLQKILLPLGIQRTHNGLRLTAGFRHQLAKWKLRTCDAPPVPMPKAVPNVQPHADSRLRELPAIIRQIFLNSPCMRKRPVSGSRVTHADSQWKEKNLFNAGCTARTDQIIHQRSGRTIRECLTQHVGQTPCFSEWCFLQLSPGSHSHHVFLTLSLPEN